MRKLILSILTILSYIVANGQRVYFVYLQSENQKPFYIKNNNSTVSSSTSGYILIPKLIDSTYLFTIGFTNSSILPQQYSIKMNGKDHGFQIKNFGDKGWGLFEQRTGEIFYSANNGSNPEKPANTISNEGSSFADILSKASDDPTLKEKPMASIEKKATVEEKKILPQEMATKTIENPVVENKKITVEQKPTIAIEATEKPYSKTVITKKSESSTTQGFGLVYVDEWGSGTVDTIKVLIPNTTYPIQTKQEEGKKAEKKFVDIPADSNSIKEINSKTITVSPVVQNETSTTKRTVIKCAAVANDNDFLKLRKIMAAADNDTGMMNEAGAYFKTICFTVEQIKNLSTLFLTDEGKYRFFDLAYSYVSDEENYKTLGQQIHDAYYLNRFNAMLRN